MKKRQLLLLGMLLAGTSLASAQTAYTYVQQKDAKLSALGTAAFTLGDTGSESNPEVTFDSDGNAVMTINSQTVAKLPTENDGQLVVEFTTTLTDAQLNTVSKSVAYDFATIYSPFQLKPTSLGNMELYSPTYNDEQRKMNCNSTTKVSETATIPVWSPILISKGQSKASSVTFSIETGAPSTMPTTDLEGSTLALSTLPTPGEGECIYTMGRNTKEEKLDEVGFFPYSGTTLGAGLCYLIAAEPEDESEDARFIGFDFDEPTGINTVNSYQVTDNKYDMFNVAGQKVNANAKGLVIVNGKKIIK